MNFERLPCRSPNCPNTILPATAKANNGLCAPCMGKIRQAERDEYIRQNRRSVDPYQGVSDPVEMICIMLTARKHDPLIQYLPASQSAEELFSQLTDAQATRLKEISAEAMKTGKEDFSEDIGKSLATLTSQNLDAMLHAWIDVQHFWPSVAFRNAGASVRGRIIKAIHEGTASINHALCALAWIGDTAVQQQFAAWEMHPPTWRKNLHVGPASYAHVGGWELKSASRRNLFFDECLALVAAEPGASASEIRLVAETSEVCPWCEDRLVHLLEIPCSDPAFRFLQLEDSVLPVLTCERCTCFADHLFARIGPDGRAKWHPANHKPDFINLTDREWERGPWKAIAVKLEPRSPIHAIDWCMPVSTTQVGGMPSWVQDTAYPKCPDCTQTMKFLAQLDNGHFKGHEGIYYAFWCSGCRITATAYQQT